jgi:hypothetical protein
MRAYMVSDLEGGNRAFLNPACGLVRQRSIYDGAVGVMTVGSYMKLLPASGFLYLFIAAYSVRRGD